MFKSLITTLSGFLVGVISFLVVLKGLLPPFIVPLAMGVYVLYLLNVYKR